MAEHVTLETALSPAAEIQFHQGGPISATWLNGSTVEVFVVYSDAGGLKMASSTDGGKTYGETTITTTTGLIGQTVWYDRWTPGDTTGNLLHIAVSNPANEQIKYFSWNLSTHSAGSTTDDIMYLKMISASNLMRSRIWDDSASTWLTEFTIATNVGDADQKELYPNMFSATLDKTTGNIFLIYKAVTEAILFERFI